MTAEIPEARGRVGEPQNPVARLELEHKASMHKLLGRSDVRRETVPEDLKGEFDRLHANSVQRETSLVIDQLIIFQDQLDSSEDTELKDLEGRDYPRGVLNAFTTSLRGLPFGRVIAENSQGVEAVSRDQLIEFQANAEADMIRLDSGIAAKDLGLLDSARSYTEGRIAGVKWVLGRRETLEREQPEPQLTS
jgi:hypothetical protein